MDLAKKAIAAALQQNWAEAIDCNLSILEDTPSDCEARNRLGFAYLQKGDLKKAALSYAKVLKLDPYNPIANKSLDKIKLLKSSSGNSSSPQFMAASFLEEPGKTKTVSLVRLADTKTLATLTVGTHVNLIPKNFRINVHSETNTYLGSLPDDLAFKLNRLIKLGYKYECFIKSVTGSSASVFIRELSRSKKAKFLPSFPYSSHTVTNLHPIDAPVFQTPIDTTPTGEEEEG